MLPKISIIVPVYNAEQYISQCINSILSQSYTNYELLLINDGSKDNSGKLCDEYARKDPRIKVFHKTNGGVSSARNLGLAKARGKYVTFIDSDDYILEEYLASLIKYDGSHFIVGGMQSFGMTQRVERFLSSEERGDENINIAITRELGNFSFGTPWGKLYDNDLLQNRTIRFDEKIIIAEDTLFIMQFLLYCQSISFSDHADYMYRISNQCKYLLNEEQFLYTFQHLENAYTKLSVHFDIKEESRKDLIYKLIYYYFSYLDKKPFHLEDFTIFFKTMERAHLPYKVKGKSLYSFIQHLIYYRLYLLAFFLLKIIKPAADRFRNKKA